MNFLETILTILDRIACYCEYDFPEDCNVCPDNRFCLILHIADIEATSIKKFQRLVEQEERMKALQEELKSTKVEIQWFYSGG